MENKNQYPLPYEGVPPHSQRETIKVTFIRDLGYDMDSHLSRSFWKIKHRDRLIAEFVFDFTFSSTEENDRFVREIQIKAMELCEQLGIDILFIGDVEVFRMIRHDIANPIYN